MVLLQKTIFFNSLDSQDLPDMYCFAFWYGFFAGDFWHESFLQTEDPGVSTTTWYFQV